MNRILSLLMMIMAPQAITAMDLCMEKKSRLALLPKDIIHLISELVGKPHEVYYFTDFTGKSYRIKRTAEWSQDKSTYSIAYEKVHSQINVGKSGISHELTNLAYSITAQHLLASRADTAYGSCDEYRCIGTLGGQVHPNDSQAKFIELENEFYTAKADAKTTAQAMEAAALKSFAKQL